MKVTGRKVAQTSSLHRGCWAGIESKQTGRLRYLPAAKPLKFEVLRHYQWVAGTCRHPVIEKPSELSNHRKFNDSAFHH